MKEDCVGNVNSIAECNGDKGAQNMRCNAADGAISFYYGEVDDFTRTWLVSTKFP